MFTFAKDVTFLRVESKKFLIATWFKNSQIHYYAENGNIMEKINLDFVVKAGLASNYHGFSYYSRITFNQQEFIKNVPWLSRYMQSVKMWKEYIRVLL